LSKSKKYKRFDKPNIDSIEPFKLESSRQLSPSDREIAKQLTATMKTQRYSTAEISKKLGLSTVTISAYWNEIKAEWKVEYLDYVNQYESDIFKSCDLVISTAWTAWERSRKNVKIKTKGKQATGKGQVLIDTVQSIEQLGDPRYLDQINKANGMKLRLLGHDGKIKQSIENKNQSNDNLTKIIYKVPDNGRNNDTNK
jgi:DNA-binding CsgD family transcriptional regulator